MAHVTPGRDSTLPIAKSLYIHCMTAYAWRLIRNNRGTKKSFFSFIIKRFVSANHNGICHYTTQFGNHCSSA
jgi:hypothetical protein